MPDSPAFDALRTEELLIHVRDGNQDAWREVYRRYRTHLSNTAHRVAGTPLGEADDVLQSAFLSAWKDIESFSYRGQGSFRAWLETIIVHKNANSLRKRVRRADMLRPRNLDSEILRRVEDPEAENPANSVLNDEEQRRLFLCMEEHLDDLAREIIILRHLENLTTRQVADVMEITPEQVRRRYRAAMTKVAGLLAQGEDNAG